MYRNILVPTDGSDRARAATARALAVAERDGAALHALHVVETDLTGEPALSTVELVVDDLEDAGHELVDELAAAARERGLPCTRRVCHSDPAEEILAYADEVGADLVVLGLAGWSHRYRAGEVAEEVAAKARQDVLAVRQDVLAV